MGVYAEGDYDPDTKTLATGAADCWDAEANNNEGAYTLPTHLNAGWRVYAYTYTVGEETYYAYDAVYLSRTDFVLLGADGTTEYSYGYNGAYGYEGFPEIKLFVEESEEGSASLYAITSARFVAGETSCDHSAYDKDDPGSDYTMTIFSTGDCETAGSYWVIPVCNTCHEPVTELLDIWEEVPVSGHAYEWTDVTNYEYGEIRDEDGKFVSYYFIAEEYRFDGYCVICGHEESLTFSYEDLSTDVSRLNGTDGIGVDYGFTWEYTASDDADCTLETLEKLTVTFTRDLVNGEAGYDATANGTYTWTVELDYVTPAEGKHVAGAVFTTTTGSVDAPVVKTEGSATDPLLVDLDDYELMYGPFTNSGDWAASSDCGLYYLDEDGNKVEVELTFYEVDADGEWVLTDEEKQEADPDYTKTCGARDGGRRCRQRPHGPRVRDERGHERR